jgi:hypothetical protein
MRWETCLEEHIVHKQVADADDIAVLLRQSDNTMHTTKRIETDEQTARSKALLAYDAVREALEALSAQKGYDVHNHECYKAFLRDVIGAAEAASTFNDLRKRRNQLEYDASPITVSDAELFVETADQLRNDVLFFVDD